MTARPDFVRCYNGGRRYFSRNFVLFTIRREEAALPWRLGMAVTKKTGSAVWRNRVRRLIRETFRLCQGEIASGLDYVVVPKRVLDPRGLDRAQVEAELLPLLRGIAGRRSAP